MERIQFYPSDELNAALRKDSEKKGVKVSVIVTDILNAYYNLSDEKAGKISEADIEDIVFKEISEYINNPKNVEKEFELSEISPTFHNIHMTYAGEPRTLRARLGKKFFKLVEKGEGEYSKVRQVMTKKGTPKRSHENRSAMYKVVIE